MDIKKSKPGSVDIDHYCWEKCLMRKERELISGACPICLNGLCHSKLARLAECNHEFCKTCIDEWLLQKKECPLCRAAIKEIVIRLVVPLPRLAMDGHWNCVLSEYKFIEKYLSELTKEWQKFVQAMFTLTYVYDVKGSEVLKLNCTKSLKKKEKGFVVLSEREKTQVILSCSIPQFMIRLAITEREDNPIEADNKYADNVVERLNKQFQACWKVTPQLYKDLNSIYVRNFENHTVTLILNSYDHSALETYHVIMDHGKTSELKKCNFDESHFLSLRHNTAGLNLSELYPTPKQEQERANCRCKELNKSFLGF